MPCSPRPAFAGFLFAAALLASGCGSGKGTVSGTVAHKNGKKVSMQAANVTLTSPPDGTKTTENCIDAYGNAPPSGTCTTSYPYTRSTEWSTTTSPDALRRIIRVTVTWTDGLGKPHSVIAARQKDPSQ